MNSNRYTTSLITWATSISMNCRIYVLIHHFIYRISYVVLSSIYFILVFGICSCLFSCDKIEGPFKEDIGINDTTSCPQANFTSQAIIRKVLLEEFTGHTCGNCPASHEISESLRQLYGNSLIVISAHAGSFAFPKNNTDSSFSYDFRSSCGNELDNTFGNDAAGLPNGLVDRKKVNGNHIIRPSAWGTEIQKGLASPVSAGIQIVTDYESATRKLCVSVQTEFVNSIQGTYKLMAYLVEDSIVNWQKDYRKTPENIPDYLHRHVLRSSMNGTFGETIARGQIQSGSKSLRNYSIKINPAYHAGHCSIVAFLADSITSEVMQVEEKRITP
jgi:hypothetical protein